MVMMTSISIPWDGHHGDNLDSVYGEDSVSLMLTLFKRRSFVLVLFLPFNQDILILSV